MKILEKDNYLFGLAIGILAPALLFGIILVMNHFLIVTGIAKFRLDLQAHILLGIAANLLPIRYYFVNLKYDKTGRGVLLMTFVTVLLFFALKDIIFKAG